MARSLLIMSAFLMNCSLGNAQSVPVAEVFAGYSHLWQGNQTAPGWNASASVNTNRWLGVVADFSGHYFPEEIFGSASNSGKSRPSHYRFLVGPQLSWRTPKRLTPGIHALVGLTQRRIHTSGISNPGYPFSSEAFPYSVTTTDNDFGGAVGATLDIQATDRVAVRLIQFDYLGNPSAVRFSVGIVMLHGRRGQ